MDFMTLQVAGKPDQVAQETVSKLNILGRQFCKGWSNTTGKFLGRQELAGANGLSPKKSVSATLQVGQTPCWPQAFHFLSFSHSFRFSHIDRILMFM